MEITGIAEQTVANNQNVLFTAVPVGCSSRNIFYRLGSGIIKLKGITQQCRARYRVSFNGNVAIPSGGAVQPIEFAIAIDGEPVYAGAMISTPAAVSEYNNIASTVFIDVPKCCCSTISIKNIGGGSAVISNSNLIIERVA